MSKKNKDPLQDHVRRLIQDRAEARGREYLRSVRPVGIEYDEDPAELIGSAVLLALGDDRFVLTVGHVADWGKQGALMLAGATEFVDMPALHTSAHPHGRDNDPHDVAVGKLDPATVAKLGDVRFLSVEDLAAGHADNSTSSPRRAKAARPWRC
jgi:hypothetical protein